MENNLKVLRAMRRITQDELGKKLHVSRQTINAIETEKYDPSLELAFKMATYFETPIEKIFSYKEEEKDADKEGK